MSDDQRSNRAEDPAAPVPARKLSPAAQRALAEAEERRKTEKLAGSTVPAELGGQKGPDPARYGDWEKGGIASDF